MREHLQRLLARVQQDPATQCWNWTGAFSQSGWRGVFYPEARIYTRVWRLNRFVLIAHRGLHDVPKSPEEGWPAWLDRARRFYTEQEAAHTCDNARCLNPQHLEWKGHRANVQEQAERRGAVEVEPGVVF